MAKVRIPRDLVPENTEMKDFYLNDEQFFVQVGELVELSDEKAEVVENWIDSQNALIKKREQREKELKELKN